MVGNFLLYYWYCTLRGLIDFVKWSFAICMSDESLAKLVRNQDTMKRVLFTTQKGDMNKLENKGKYDTEIVVKDKRFYRTVLKGDLGFGEAFMDNMFDCDNLLPMASVMKNKLYMFRARLDDKIHALSHHQYKGAESMEVIDSHYNLGNDLYEAMLGKTMNYTCGYWKEGTKDLDEAQINKMELFAQKLKLKPGMKLLDLGSGFGSMAKYLAEKHGVSVVGYNICPRQVEYARESCKGLDVEFRQEDYRNATGQYDRVYSVGFYEHVGAENYHVYHKLVHSCLKDDGLSLVQTMTSMDRGFVRQNVWIEKYIFPGGQIPYLDEHSTAVTGLFVMEDLHCLGLSYALTFKAWRENFIRNWDTIEPNYGKRVNGKFYRMWIMYLNWAEVAFQSRQLGLHQIVYSKGIPEGYISVR